MDGFGRADRGLGQGSVLYNPKNLRVSAPVRLKDGIRVKRRRERRDEVEEKVKCEDDDDNEKRVRLTP